MTTPKPPCPACGAPVDLVRETPGANVAYPCNCWLTTQQTHHIGEQDTEPYTLPKGTTIVPSRGA